MKHFNPLQYALGFINYALGFIIFGFTQNSEYWIIAIVGLLIFIAGTILSIYMFYKSLHHSNKIFKSLFSFIHISLLIIITIMYFSVTEIGGTLPV